MKESPRGADMLVRSIRQAGISKIFTLSGNHIMPVYDAILSEKLQIVHTRHEGAAVHMADAWARLTAGVGLALVTGGPGHANAVSALYAYVFANKRANRMKILVHDGLGVWLAARRLNQGRFVWPRAGQIRIELSDEQLQALVIGLPWHRIGEGGIIDLI